MNSRKIVITFITQLILTLIGIITTKIVLTALSPSAYGMFGYAYALAGIFFIFSDFYLGSVYFQRLSAGRNVQKQFSTYIIIKLTLVMLSLFVFLIYSIFITFIVKSIDISAFWVLCVVFLSYVADIILNSYLSIYQARRNVKISQFAYLFVAVFNLIFILLFVYTTRNIYLFSLSFVLKSLAGAALLAYYLKNELSYFDLKIDWDIAKDYFNYVKPLFLMSIFNNVYAMIDPIILKMFLSFSAVGFFVAAQKYNAMILMASGSLMSILYSSFSEHASSNNYKKIEEVSNKATKYISIPVVLCSMFVYFNAPYFVEIFMSRQYLPAVPIIQIFMFQVVLMSVSRTFDSIVFAAEKLRYAGFMGIAMYLIGILLDFILIPDKLFGIKMFGLGVSGPAMKLLIVYILSIIIAAIYLKHRLKIMIYWRFIFHIISALIAGYISIYILPMHDINSLFYLFISFSKYLLFYLLLLVLIKEIEYHDLLYVLNALKIWK